MSKTAIKIVPKPVPAPKPTSTFKSLPTNLKVKQPTGSKSEIEVLPVDGVEVAQFCLAAEQEKAAKAAKTELRPQMLATALPHIFKTNCAAKTAKELVKSVKIQDTTGSVVRVTFKSVYPPVDKTAAIGLFEEINEGRKASGGPFADLADLGKYATETLVASFNSDAFLDTNGDFDVAKYNKYREAIERVAKQLGQECPLESKDVVRVKDTFDGQRWTDFNVDENTRLSEVFTNTVDVAALDNQHATIHLFNALQAKVEDGALSDADFRETVRALLAERTALLSMVD